MSGIKFVLQKEVFDGYDERILSVLSVSKLYKRKKNSYLCISTTKNHLIASIHEIKQYDKGVYKKKRSWALTDVKVVDGKNETIDCHELDIHFEKQYKWITPNLHERQHFIGLLYKQILKYIIKDNTADKQNMFRNIPKAWLLDKSPEKLFQQNLNQSINGGHPGGGGGDDDDDGVEDFHALTEKEEFDLNQLMGDCSYAISNADLFMENLTKNLHQLDGEIVQSVLASAEQVESLMEQIEATIQQAELIESRVDAYDEILAHIRDTMEKMEEKNAMIDIANNNSIKLQQELENVILQLDLPYSQQIALTETDLTNAAGLAAAITAAKALQNALNSDINPALLPLTAIQDQRKRFEKWKAKFSQTVSRHLNNMFIHLGNDLGEEQMHHTSNNDLVLAKHNAVHKELIAYAELMHWSKAMDRKTYDGLVKVYTSSLSKVYDRNIHHFFEQARQLIGGGGSSGTLTGMGGTGGGTVGGSSGGGGGGTLKDEMNTSMTNKFKSHQPSAKQLAAHQSTYGILGINKDLWTHGLQSAERQKFDTILEKVLAELEPVALSEQLFCITFFQLDVLSPTTKNTQTTLDANYSTTIANESISSSLMTSSQRDELGVPQKRINRQINEDVRKMMIALFGNLELELNNFILTFEKLDSFYSMYVLVRLTQHVMSAQDAQSFLSMTFASALVQIKRSFDRFMQMQLNSIRESKVPKRSKCGLLPYVENFEVFSNTAENVFRKTERRTDIDKWYLQLVAAIFEQIPLHANEHSKTPHQVVKMENFHHMHSLIAQLKVTILDNLKKDAKIKYNESLRAYVTKYFGRPLEKLNIFFDGVQQKVLQGVKETEISYQMAYSKQELRKVINQYPAREVKRGLESLYKKVEKHLCEEENLLQVVWRAMQEEFIVQYNFLEERIQRCYAGAMISLEFTIDDILAFFSEIAISH